VRPRRIEVAIEEVVLHGLPRFDTDAFAAELTRLLGEQGLGPGAPAADVEVARVDAGTVRLGRKLGPGLARAAFRATIDAAQGRSAP
jgi:hypothetical protein